MVYTINGKRCAPYSQGAKLLWSQFTRDGDGTKLYMGILCKILVDLQERYEQAIENKRHESVAWAEAKISIFRKEADEYRWEVFQWMESQDWLSMSQTINQIMDEESKSRFQQTGHSDESPN